MHAVSTNQIADILHYNDSKYLVYLKDVDATYLSDSPLYSFCEAENDNMLHGFQSYI